MAVALEMGWNGLPHMKNSMSKKRAWGDDHQKLLEMMLGKPFDESSSRDKHTLDLLGGSSGSSSSSSVSSDNVDKSDFLELGQDLPLPSGWEKRLDLKSGTVFFINWNTGKTTNDDPRNIASNDVHMSLDLLQSRTKDEQLDLKLNLSSKQETRSPEHSPRIFQESQESRFQESPNGYSPCLLLLPDSGRKEPKVTLTGCKRCLMYVMISPSDPKCPKCGSSVIVDFPIPKKRKLDLEL